MGNNLSEYLNYWGLAAAPFDKVGKDPGQLYFPNEWQSLLDRLVFFCNRSGSLMVVTTDPGHCKSTLLRWLCHTLEPSKHEVLTFSMFQSPQKPNWLVSKLVKLAGISCAQDDEPLEKLGQTIDELCFNERTLTVLIDEAHKLTNSESLDQLHSLISVQSLVYSSVNVVLCGNHELLKILEESDQLRNRVSMAASIPKLSSDQVQTYLNTHFQKIGLSPNIISFDALTSIHHLSWGLFSRLNTLVENCLIEAFLRKEKTIHSETVLAAGRYLPRMGQATGIGEAAQVNASTGQSLTKLAAETRNIQTPGMEPTRTQSIELRRLFFKNEDSKNK